MMAGAGRSTGSSASPMAAAKAPAAPRSSSRSLAVRRKADVRKSCTSHALGRAAIIGGHKRMSQMVARAISLRSPCLSEVLQANVQLMSKVQVEANVMCDSLAYMTVCLQPTIMNCMLNDPDQLHTFAPGCKECFARTSTRKFMQRSMFTRSDPSHSTTVAKDY